MFNESNTGWLFKKNKLGKVLNWRADNTGGFVGGRIYIQHGQVGGKHQTEVTYVEGKANRDTYQQTVLQITSLYNKQRDKGYKSSKDLGILAVVHEEGDEYYTTNIDGDKRKWGTEIEAVEALLPDELTDASGNLKPMKCTPIEKAWKKVIYPCFVQPKLDGVRCFVVYNGEKWIALSSSGKSYDIAARYILEVINRCNIPTNYILDGELYIHGKLLQDISGWCRKQTPIEEHKNLQYHIFDLGDNTTPFEERIETLMNLFVETIDDNDSQDLIHSVFTIESNVENDIKTFHNDFVSQGYEGCIVRNFELGYEFGRRSTNIFKLKDFKDEEFDIIGVKEGKRGSEDMVFLCKTEHQREFAANPIGTREQKEYWFKNMNSWAGKKGTVRYLTLSNDGIPTGNPVLKVIRDYD